MKVAKAKRIVETTTYATTRMSSAEATQIRVPQTNKATAWSQTTCTSYACTCCPNAFRSAPLHCFGDTAETVSVKPCRAESSWR